MIYTVIFIIYNMRSFDLQLFEGAQAGAQDNLGDYPTVNTADFTQHWFTQRLDHFDYTSTETF